MSPAMTLILYCAAIVAASLAGGWLPMLVRLTHRRLQVALSFISGVMLGVAALLLLPHAFEMQVVATQTDIGRGGDAHALGHDLLTPVMLWMLAGFLGMFFIERFFCFHHHDAPDDADNAVAAAACGHDHAQPHTHAHDAPTAHALTWSGAAIGLTLHSLLDGVALAASVSVARTGEAGLLAGLGTFLVVLLHKPFDSLTLGTLMAAGRQPAAMRHIVNLGFALLVPLGAALFMLGLTSGDSQSLILSAALAFAAGTFLCIALSDLLPELQFHQHDRITLTAALVIGLAVAWGIARMESRLHVHSDEPATAASHEGHGH
jgi:zinc and cadmium transporter